MFGYLGIRKRIINDSGLLTQ